MSLAQALSEAVVEASSQLGEAVTVDGQAYMAIVTDVTEDEIIVAGGVADQGGFRIAIPKSYMEQRPADMVEVTARGRTMKLLSVESRRAHWNLIAFNPASRRR